MIVRPRPSALQLLFIVRGSIVPTIAPRVLVVLGMSVAIVWLHRVYPQHLGDLTPAPFTLLGLALAHSYCGRKLHWDCSTSRSDS